MRGVETHGEGLGREARCGDLDGVGGGGREVAEGEAPDVVAGEARGLDAHVARRGDDGGAAHRSAVARHVAADGAVAGSQPQLDAGDRLARGDVHEADGGGEPWFGDLEHIGARRRHVLDEELPGRVDHRGGHDGIDLSVDGVGGDLERDGGPTRIFAEDGAGDGAGDASETDVDARDGLALADGDARGLVETQRVDVPEFGEARAAEAQLVATLGEPAEGVGPELVARGGGDGPVGGVLEEQVDSDAADRCAGGEERDRAGDGARVLDDGVGGLAPHHFEDEVLAGAAALDDAPERGGEDEGEHRGGREQTEQAERGPGQPRPLDERADRRGDGGVVDVADREGVRSGVADERAPATGDRLCEPPLAGCEAQDWRIEHDPEVVLGVLGLELDLERGVALVGGGDPEVALARAEDRHRFELEATRRLRRCRRLDLDDLGDRRLGERGDLDPDASRTSGRVVGDLEHDAGLGGRVGEQREPRFVDGDPGRIEAEHPDAIGDDDLVVVEDRHPQRDAGARRDLDDAGSDVDAHAGSGTGGGCGDRGEAHGDRRLLSRLEDHQHGT